MWIFILLFVKGLVGARAPVSGGGHQHGVAAERQASGDLTDPLAIYGGPDCYVSK
jgi:hypothetical protein